MAHKGTWGVIAGISFLLAASQSCTRKYDGDCGMARNCTADVLGGASGGGEGGAAGADAGSGSGGRSQVDVDLCEVACDGETPICDASSAQCVECTASSGCEEGLCDESTHSCVECLDGSDCTADEPRCEGGSCVGCEENADCAGIAGKEQCHVPSGACVECLPGEHDACGDGRLCHGELRKCVEAEAGAAPTCQPCVADAHCRAGFRCVAPNRFGEEGSFCLPEPDPGCASRRPFVLELEEVTTIDGETLTVCGHAFTSCAGFNDFRTAVDGCSLATDPPPDGDGNAACGLLGAEDNTYCRAFSGEARCTYRCSSKDDCLCGHDCVEQVCAFAPNSETCN